MGVLNTKNFMISDFLARYRNLLIQIDLCLVFVSFTLTATVYNEYSFVEALYGFVHIYTFVLCLLYGKLPHRYIAVICFATVIFWSSQGFLYREGYSMALMMIPLLNQFEARQVTRAYFISVLSVLMILTIGTAMGRVISYAESIHGGVFPTFGFSSRNMYGALMASTVCSLLHCQYPRYRWYHFAYAGFAFFMTYFAVYSRTSFMIIILMTIMMAFIYIVQPHINENLLRVLLSVGVVTVLIIALGSTVLMSISTRDGFIYTTFNALLSGRVYLMQNAFDLFGFPLLEVRGGLNGYMGTFFVLDNGLYALIAERGLIFFIFFIGLYLYATLKSVRNKVYIYAFVFMVFTCQSVVETMFAIPTYNPFLFMLLCSQTSFMYSKGDMQ